MYGINIVILAGRVGKDPVYKEFSNGGSVANISLATSKRGFTTKDGREVKEQTEWHNLVCRDSLARITRDHVKKGSQIHIQGELRTRKYTDKSGLEKFVTEVHVNDLQFLDNPPAKDSYKESTSSNDKDNNISTEERTAPPVIDDEFKVDANIVFGGSANTEETEEELPF